MIIALAGAKGSGKDTVAEKLYEYYSHQCEVRRVAFADPIKKVVQHIFELDSQTPSQYDAFKRTTISFKLRGFLSQVGEISHPVEGRRVVREIGMLMRGYDENQFVEYVSHQIIQHPNALWIVTDLRFDNELECMQQMGACIVHVQRGELVEDDSHITERGFDSSVFDVVLNNSGSVDQLGPEIINKLDNLIMRSIDETCSRNK